MVEIKRVMSAPPIVIDPDASVEEAALVMAERKIGCLPVVEGGRLVGMLTETDVLRYFAGVQPLASDRAGARDSRSASTPFD